MRAGAHDAVIANHWAKGGAGATELGGAVIKAYAEAKAAGSPFQFLYSLEMSLKEKIEIISKEIYGAATVEYSPLAEQRLAVKIRQIHIPIHTYM